MKLSDIAIRNAKPREKSYKLFDGGGLYLEVSPAGGKWWRLKYYFLGKEKRISLGTYPTISLQVARDRRVDAQRLLSMHPPVDPGQERKSARAEMVKKSTNTFELWARRWWGHWKVGKSERHSDYVIRRLEADVIPIIGDRPIQDIAAYEIVDVVKRIAARGAGEIASRAQQNIGQVFRYAIAHDQESRVARNPATDFKPSDVIQKKATKNYARIGERDLPEFLRAIDASASNPLTRMAVKLMALTFVRTSELIEAEWSDIDWKGSLWRIPVDRMKMDSPHIVPLARQTMELLKQIQQYSGSSQYLFPGQTVRSKVMSNNTILKAIEIMGYKGVMTGHGFRGLASTILHEQGFEHKHIELQLAHQERDKVSAAYNHALYLKPRTEMMQHWADYLDQMRVR